MSLRQNQGSCRELNIFLRGQEAEETEQYLSKKKKSRHEVKAIMSPFVESLSAGEHSTTPTPF